MRINIFKIICLRNSKKDFKNLYFLKYQDFFINEMKKIDLQIILHLIKL